MLKNMATVAILCLLLLERFLASDMDVFTEPVLVGLRAIERSALRYSKIPPDIITKHKKRLSKFYLFTPEIASEGVQLQYNDKSGFMYFHPGRETKVIIHGFLDKVKIARWMHHMKDEFLLLDNFNVIIVDWSVGNFIPYSQAAANTERVGEEIADLLFMMMETLNAQPSKFHLIGHSLGSHVAGHVGERIKGLKRITGLDPATHLFSSKSSKSKLDRTDAEFVDVIHTDAGGIGIPETEGHVDFYPNGGEVQPGCTASNSLRSLLEKGVVEGVRNIICSHMRATVLFTDTINGRHCQMVGHRCSGNERFDAGQCDSCGPNGEDCATMGYHVDTRRDYGNGTKFYLLTGQEPPFCGYEYKLSFDRIQEDDETWRNMVPNVFRRAKREWTSSDILHVNVYGSSGSAEFELEGDDKQPFKSVHLVLSPTDLGVVHGAIAHWSKKPLTRRRGVVKAISTAIAGDHGSPLITRIQVKPIKPTFRERNVPMVFELCANPVLSIENVQQGATFRNDYC